MAACSPARLYAALLDDAAPTLSACELTAGLLSSVAVADGNYPSWRYFPARSRPPGWTEPLIAIFRGAQNTIDSRAHTGVKSDTVLAALRPELLELGYEVESSKAQADKLSRPVLFGDEGKPRVAYEVDAFEPNHGLVVEIEAGRGAANNADYRDIVRTSLMVDARFLALGVMLTYSSGSTTWRSYEQTRDRLDAIYASDRLQLPLEGVLLIGY